MIDETKDKMTNGGAERIERANGNHKAQQSRSTYPLPRRFPTQDFLNRIRPGLVELLTSFECAHSVRGDVWDFAVEISRLRSSGLTDNDLRWLVRSRYVDHAREVTRRSDDGREYRQTGDLSFAKRTCFVLTADGALFVGAVQTNSNGEDHYLPTWDAQRRELRLDERVIKRFKWPAKNQERILVGFEEEGWPHRIDDPIPPKPDQDQRQRLRDAISALNRHQEIRLICFHGDGSGQGIVWQFVDSTRKA